MNGEFLNHHAGQGYILDPLRVERWGKLWRKRIWMFRLCYPHPLTYRDGNGCDWQPDRHEDETDLGSIPPPLRGLFPQDEFPLSYIYHDSACRRGGLWLVNTTPTFITMNRREADTLLRDEWIPAEVRLSGGSTWRRWPVWVGLSIARPFMPALSPQK